MSEKVRRCTSPVNQVEGVSDADRALAFANIPLSLLDLWLIAHSLPHRHGWTPAWSGRDNGSHRRLLGSARRSRARRQASRASPRTAMAMMPENTRAVFR